MLIYPAYKANKCTGGIDPRVLHNLNEFNPRIATIINTHKI